MSEKNVTDEDAGEFTPEMKAEVRERLEKSWSEKWDQPSEAPGFEDATPQILAKVLFRLVKKAR